MSRKKLAVPWILFGITAIVCIVLVIFIVVQDKETGKQASGQNTEEDSNPNFQDYSNHFVRKGYYMRDDIGDSYILDEENGMGLIMLKTKDDTMFSELKNGDVIVVASDSGVDASMPQSTGAYQCIRIEIGMGDRRFLSEHQEELEEMAELGYTFEENWRR